MASVPRYWMEASGQFIFWSLYSHRKSTWHPLNRMGVSQSWSGYNGEDKIPYPGWESKLACPAQSLSL